ncbi:hypothetical protein GCM10011352_17630 [Marinobacterium zhoushanense]|uniref:Rhodanese domain-containing protein n=1 Tax=Marinobacterium zhoushanense TaxID=1679163 RepID=A0ABQ1KAH7_9GAMM|nr:rhodanese-like domain-containing protein [Marinobacterium zhoushanense]GGB92038.1 hypothetical protein GCM10011352_17630 [Marinobacterium zhoushanense]
MVKQLIALMTLLPALLLTLVAQAGPQEDTGWKKIADGALLVDVRTEQEYASGHLDGALLIPYQQIVQQFADRDIPKDQPVVLYCRSGNRAGIAERALSEAGYTQVFNAGGFTALEASKPANLRISN